jgi:hypothetical protein
MNAGLRWAQVASLALVLFTSSAAALVLSFNPSSQTVGLGAPASVDVRVSDVLPAGLGAYDFDVTFDPTILAYNNVVDGLGLGFAIGLGATPGVGTVTVSDFSLEAPADLLALQTNEFVLFSIVFDTLALGTSPLGFSAVILGDAEGDQITPAGLTGGSITVAAVPEPGALGLLLTAGLAVGWAGRRAAKRD